MTYGFPVIRRGVVLRSFLLLLVTVLPWGTLVAVSGAGAVEDRSAAAPTYTALDGVSCTSATACVAVGGTAKGGDSPTTLAFRPLAELWNGSSWRVMPTPKPAHFTSSQLKAVSCVAANNCVAVGFSFRNSIHRNGFTMAFAERWNGIKWTLQTIPKLPPYPRASSLVAVSCATAASCIAVGSYDNGRTVLALIEQWNGRTWKMLPSPHPRALIDRLMFLFGVSCSTPTACVAVGHSTTGRGYSPGRYDVASLAELWTGRRWLIEPTPRPYGADQAFLEGVSCVKADSCVAAGWDAFPTEQNKVLLAESWNGNSWKLEPTAEPPRPSTLNLGAISCSANTQCMAVGDRAEGLQPGAEYGVVAEQKSGGAGWAFTTVPTPPGERLGGLSAVSCVTPNNCTAVGNVDDGLNTTVQQLIEHWDGSNWSIQRNPTP
jgi:hypothetical protein